MIKFIFILAALVILNANSFSGQITSDGKTSASGLDVRVISDNAAGTKLSVRLPAFSREQETFSGISYEVISIEDAVSVGEPGQAALPVVNRFIQIPNGKEVSLKIIPRRSEEFSVGKIIPYTTPPSRENSPGALSVEEDPVFYSSNAFYPGQPSRINEIAVMRDIRIAVVSISPVQYNPALGKIIVHTDFDIELTYHGSSQYNNVTSSFGVTRSFEKMYRNLVLNYEGDSHFPVAPKLLILTDDSLYSGILPLAQWKERKGMKTVIVKKSEITGAPSPTSAEVKTYLTQIYNSNDRPEFVLLVGDASGTRTFPWFTATGGKSDHPYQCLDGTDILPDLVVGRISVQSKTELDSAVAKLIQYERQPNMIQTDWYKRAIVLHSDDGIDPINGQVARNVFLNEGGFSNVAMVNNSFTQSQVTGLINEGVSWIWFIGHGSATSWADPVWSMSNMPNLTYGVRQPSIVSIACSNADLDYSSTNNCFGEEWIERGTHNSASNIAASTELCAFYTTDTIGREMLYSYFRYGICDFGSMLNFGKIKAYQYFNGNGTVTETINQYMVLGDPSQEAFSDRPANLSVTSSVTGIDYIVNVKSEGENVRGALVAIHQTDSLMTSGYTDSLGNYVFDKNLLTESSPVTGVVTGTNLHPFEGQLILTSLSLSNNIAETFALEQNFPNPFNPGTVIRFSLPKKDFATLRVYDMLGRLVAEPVSGELQSGSYSINFDATNLSAGVYLYRLEAGSSSKTMKMTLIK